MPGAGSSTVAFVPESSYNTTPGTPTYYLPGTNVQFETAEIDRNLLRLAKPGDAEDADAIAQRLDGQLSVSFIPTSADFHRILFNNGTNTGFASGRAASCEWYLGVDLLGGSSVERQIQGWAPQTAEISYNGSTEACRVTLTGFYAEESKNASISPGSITNNTTGNEVPGHGADLTVNSSTVSKLQSATVRFEDISRPHFGSTDPIAVDAVLGDVNESVTMEGIFEGSTYLEYAYGSSSATSIEDFVTAQNMALTLDHDTTTIVDYTFGDCKPRNYDWQTLVEDGDDLTEPMEWWATSVTATAP